MLSPEDNDELGDGVEKVSICLTVNTFFSSRGCMRLQLIYFESVVGRRDADVHRKGNTELLAATESVCCAHKLCML